MQNVLPIAEIDEFAVEVFLNTNGYYWRKPRGAPVVCVALEQEAHALFIRNLIESGLFLQGRHIPATHLQGQLGVLRVLTGYFAARNFSPRSFQLKTLTSWQC